MTELTYLENPDLYETTASVEQVGKDDRGFYIVLNRTIFYPQGGGQPTDTGEISVKDKSYSVIYVKNVEGEIRHYIQTENIESLQNQEVSLKIDVARRCLNSRYHTAAHFISTIIEKLYPPLKAIKGHQFPGEAYVEFNAEFPQENNLIEKINAQMDNALTSGISISTKMINPKEFEELFKNLPYQVPMDKPLRSVMIDSLPIPCGGTHAKSAQELGKVRITKMKKNKILHYTLKDGTI